MTYKKISDSTVTDKFYHESEFMLHIRKYQDEIIHQYRAESLEDTRVLDMLTELSKVKLDPSNYW